MQSLQTSTIVLINHGKLLLIFFLTELYIQLNQNGKEFDQNKIMSSKNILKSNKFNIENKIIKSDFKNTKEFYQVDKKH